MQRDMDLAVTILGAFRDSPAAALTLSDVAAAVQESGLPDLGGERVAHHIEILCDAALIKQVSPGFADSSATWRLTWQGYDTLDGDNDDDYDAE